MFHITDQELLLLAHDELTGWRRVIAQGHLAICPRCQTRFAKFVGASRLLADAVRGGDLPRWRLPTPQAAVTAARTASIWRIAALALLIATVAVVTQGGIRLAHRSAGQNAAPQSVPCRPDLHSDNCQ